MKRHKIAEGNSFVFLPLKLCLGLSKPFLLSSLDFSIVLVTSEIVPEFIGWLGIVAGVFVGLGTGIKLIKPKFRGEIIGALLAMLFEILIGGWLLFFPILLGYWN